MSQYVISLSDPAQNFAAVTPSDTDNFVTTSTKAALTKGLYVGTGGDVTAVMENGTAVLFANVPSGTILPIRCIRVNDTGTDAEDIVRLW